MLRVLIVKGPQDGLLTGYLPITKKQEWLEYLLAQKGFLGHAARKTIELGTDNIEIKTILETIGDQCYSEAHAKYIAQELEQGSYLLLDKDSLIKTSLALVKILQEANNSRLGDKVQFYQSDIEDFVNYNQGNEKNSS